MKNFKKLIVLSMISMMFGTISPVASLASVENTETILEGKKIIENGVDENGIAYTVYEGFTSEKLPSVSRIIDTRHIVRYVTTYFSTPEQALNYAEGGIRTMNWKETIDGAVYTGTLKSTGEYILVGCEVTLIYEGDVIGVI